MTFLHQHRCNRCGDLWEHRKTSVKCPLPTYAACDKCVGKKVKRKRKRD